MKLSQVKKGDVLISDGGFTCIKVGQRLLVRESEDGLWVTCACGRHYLTGQISFDDPDQLVGLRKAE